MEGKQRGPDMITLLETSGLRIVHMGAIGPFQLRDDQTADIGRVDVLMIPVGGFFTVDGAQAAALIDQLHPRVIIPMHYGTPVLNADLRSKPARSVGFLTAMKGKATVMSVKARDLKLSPASCQRPRPSICCATNGETRCLL